MFVLVHNQTWRRGTEGLLLFEVNKNLKLKMEYHEQRNLGKTII